MHMNVDQWVEKLAEIGVWVGLAVIAMIVLFSVGRGIIIKMRGRVPVLPEVTENTPPESSEGPPRELLCECCGAPAMQRAPTVLQNRSALVYAVVAVVNLAPAHSRVVPERGPLRYCRVCAMVADQLLEGEIVRGRESTAMRLASFEANLTARVKDALEESRVRQAQQSSPALTTSLSPIATLRAVNGG
jgi:uncharacterized protein YuzB (UPF0349 family)